MDDKVTTNWKTYATSSTTVRVQNGGTVVNAGDVPAGSPISKVLGLNNLADDLGQTYGTIVVALDGTGADTTDLYGVSGINPSVALGYKDKSDEWIVRGVATKIGGVANNVLLSKSADFDNKSRDFVNELATTRFLGSGNSTTFNYYAKPDGTLTPNFVRGSGAGTLQAYVRPSGNGRIPAIDDAAVPTRAIPGELTYRFGGAVPKNDVYKAKDAYES